MTLIIAHHLPDGIVRQLEPKLPEGVALAGTPKAPDHWQVPAEAMAMILLPPHGGVYYPPEKPAGWPFGLKWVQAVSTGVDDYPKWVWEVANATCGRGTQSNAIAEFAVELIELGRSLFHRQGPAQESVSQVCGVHVRARSQTFQKGQSAGAVSSVSNSPSNGMRVRDRPVISIEVA